MASCLLAIALAACWQDRLAGQVPRGLRRLPPIAAGENSLRVPANPGGPLAAHTPSAGQPPADTPFARLVEFQETLPGPSIGGEEPFGDPLDLIEGVEVIPLEIPLGSPGGCASCGGCGSCGSCGCWCEDCQSRTRIGRFFCGVYHGMCCPDPCYDPHWKALADSAFFTEAARPVTQSRLRWDAGLNMVLPDRAEYFWARSGGGGRGRPAVETSLTYHDLTHYNEVAHGAFSAFTEYSYRSLDPETNTHTAGFGDLIAGTKAMLFDCELLQITFQTKFITPLGASAKGFGTGHLSIEPSLIAGVNLGPRSYLQAQVAEWIPVAGDNAYAGALVHYHVAYNRTLLGAPKGIHVIGSTELNGWTFQDGAYSDPVLGQLQPASGETYLSVAAGLRMIICERCDFGLGYAHAVTENHWAEQLFRTEMRMRF